MHLVIDTQALLDWRFFRDPGCADWPLPPGRDSAHRWIATAAGAAISSGTPPCTKAAARSRASMTCPGPAVSCQMR